MPPVSSELRARLEILEAQRDVEAVRDAALERRVEQLLSELAAAEEFGRRHAAKAAAAEVRVEEWRSAAEASSRALVTSKEFGMRQAAEAEVRVEELRSAAEASRRALVTAKAEHALRERDLEAELGRLREEAQRSLASCEKEAEEKMFAMQRKLDAMLAERYSQAKSRTNLASEQEQGQRKAQLHEDSRRITMRKTVSLPDATERMKSSYSDYGGSGPKIGRVSSIINSRSAQICEVDLTKGD